MEASIIFHFAGRGNAMQRLALVDFAQLLDPRWKAPRVQQESRSAKTATSFLHEVAHSVYNFVQGGRLSYSNEGRVWYHLCILGIAGAFGATIVYPIDLGAPLA